MTCECGASLKAPDDWAGRRARCRKCKAVVRIPILSADENEISLSANAEDAVAPVVQNAAFTAPSNTPDEWDDLPAGPTLGRIPGYLVDCGRATYGFLASWKLANFLFCVAIMMGICYAINVIPAVREWDEQHRYTASYRTRRHAPMWVILCFLVFFACLWLLTHLLNILVNAANGDREIPALPGVPHRWNHDATSESYTALARGVLAITVSFGPLLLYCAGVWIKATLDEADAVPSASLFNILLAYGVLTLPVALLLANLGHLQDFFRPDRTLAAIGRTAAAYAIPVAFTAALAYSLTRLFGLAPGTEIPDLHGWEFVTAPAGVILLGFVSMLVIGLYHHHYRDGFEWLGE